MQKPVYKHSLQNYPQQAESRNNLNECPSVEEQMNKSWYIYKMKCHLALKRNEVLIRTTTDERNWLQKTNIARVQLHNLSGIG